MGFSSRFFVALLAICIVRGVHADCSAEEYNLTCPSADSSLGWQFAKCKLLDSNCDGTGCQKYEACFQVPGNDAQYFYDVSVECHLENEHCVSNTKSCSEFNYAVDVSGNNGLNTTANPIFCQEQTGMAQWDNGQWDVSGCLCKGSAQIQRYKCVTKYELTATSIDSSGEIVYSDVPRYYYCTSCIPGTCPSDVQQNNNGGRCWSGIDNSNYSVCACDDVSANYYSAGYYIPPILSDLGMVNGCAVSCGDGLTTNGVTGAIGPEQCVPDGTEYQDATGSFTLGTHQCQP